MIGITANSTHYRRFSTSELPDALPTATVYADNTSLGAASVAAGPGVNDYRVTVAVPSNVTSGQEITVAINWIAGGEPQSTLWLWVGVVAAPYATAAQATAIATDAAATKTASEAAAALLAALTELDADQRRFTAKALELVDIDLQPVLDAINASEGVDSEKIAADVLAGLGSVQITRIGPEFDPATSTITLIAGDDYLVGNGNAITFGITLPGIDLSGATAVCSASGDYLPIVPGTAELIDTETETPKLRLQWTREQTSVTPSCKYSWGAAILDPAGKVKTIIGGPLTIKPAAVHTDVVAAALVQL